MLFIGLIGRAQIYKIRIIYTDIISFLILLYLDIIFGQNKFSCYAQVILINFYYSSKVKNF